MASTKTKRMIHEDDKGPYVILSRNVYRPRRPTKYGIGKVKAVSVTKSQKSIRIGDESWPIAEENVIWRASGII